MAKTLIEPKAFLEGTVVPIEEASLSIASSAVLYGLSVYTVFPVFQTTDGRLAAFRLREHFNRLQESAKIVGIDTLSSKWNFDKHIVKSQNILKQFL